MHLGSRAGAKVNAVAVVGPGGAAVEERQPLDFVVVVEQREGELVAVRSLVVILAVMSER